jgi:hypothetical protein
LQTPTNDFVEVLWFTKEAVFRIIPSSIFLCGVRSHGLRDTVCEQEVFMFSGLERQRTAASREKSVAWAWVKVRDTLGRLGTNRPTSKLTENILTPTVSDFQEVEKWRDRLAEVACRKLSRQICEQFYNFSIFQPWRSRPVEAVATSRMLSPALPAYCRDISPAKQERIGAERNGQARILTSVLPDKSGRRGAVLIPLRPKAA